MDEMTWNDEKFHNDYKRLREAIHNIQNMVFIKNTGFEYVAASASFARLGGDEFAVFMKDAPHGERYWTRPEKYSAVPGKRCCRLQEWSPLSVWESACI